MQKRISVILVVLFSVAISVAKVAAQPAWSDHLLDSVEEQKPAKFGEYKLGSESSSEKKFTNYRRFKQNTVTHYNYYYNSNNKINLVVAKATASYKNDYTKLLSFYPYSLDNTASQKKDLDSVIIKSTAGILLHDLRNDWVDNMYLLIGEAYFYKKDFDSAAAFFQFINYNLPPRAKGDDYDHVVGTNEDATNSVISIANPEKPNILQKVFSQPPSRNDALIWIARTLIEQNQFGDAAGMISTLKNDPNLPRRLQDDVEEMDAYLFYKQNIYDSVALHLEKALTNAKTNEDKARWDFLLAQLYEMSGKYDKASAYYQTAAKNTNDPLMDINAKLNDAKMLKNSSPAELDKGIYNLLHMAKKDKFENYRDIIYYSAAQLAMQKPDTTAAILYFNQSILANQTNTSYKNKAWLQLADIDFKRKDYRRAFADYDSLASNDTSLSAERLAEIQAKRTSLSKIVEKLNIIDREDSLQMVAAMPPAQRDAFVKNIARKLQKKTGKGKNYDDDNDNGIADMGLSPQNQSADLFANSSNKGDWYFYNGTAKTKGLSDFKVKWGKRSDADNWNRKSAVVTPTASLDNILPGGMNPDAVDTTAANKKDTVAVIQQAKDMSFVGLMSNLPLTPEKLDASNKLIAKNLFELAKLYQTDLQDYQQAINTYDESLARFPDSLYNGEIYLGLYFCYNKLGNTAKAAYYKNLLGTKFPDSRSEKIAVDPEVFNPNKKDPVITKHYEDIYNQFIEGNFDEALAEKKKADSVYGTNYWSPQLLYIESLYDIKQLCDDSVAKVTLKNLVKLYPSSPMKPKAEKMIDVLNRRAAIEKYLNNLNITRYKEDTTINVADDKPVQQQPIVQHIVDTVKKMAVPVKPVVVDTVKKIYQPVVSGDYVFDSTTQQNVAMLLDKVDPTFVNEAKNAMDRYNAENFWAQKITVTKQPFDSGQSVLIFSTFTNDKAALQYLYKLKKAAPNEISWLPPNKYSFFIISDDNLKRLTIKRDIATYKKLLNGVYQNRF